MIVWTNYLSLSRLALVLSIIYFVVTISAVFGSYLIRGALWTLTKILGAETLPMKWRTSGTLSTTLRDESKPSSEWLASWRNKWRGTGVATSVCVVLFVTFAVGGTVGIMRLQNKADIYTHFKIQIMHRVFVLSRDSPEVIKAMVMDPDTQEWNNFTFNGCGDYKITQEIQSGVVLCLLKYEEHPGCMSVAKDNLGYTLWREAHDKPPIHVANTRQAAASCPTQTSTDPGPTTQAMSRAGR